MNESVRQVAKKRFKEGVSSAEIAKQIDDWVGHDPDAVDAILGGLSDAINSTADHLRSNWQDDAAAKSWERIAAAVDKAAGVFSREKPY
jgi:tryptophan synthase beta subunit